MSVVKMELTEKKYWINNISLQVREAGPPDGKIMLFLDGFPEGWYAWRKQIPYFAAKGYRVVVPDQRAYNESSKPDSAKAYSMPILVKDVTELISGSWGSRWYWWATTGAGRWPGWRPCSTPTYSKSWLC